MRFAKHQDGFKNAHREEEGGRRVNSGRRSGGLGQTRSQARDWAEVAELLQPLGELSEVCSAHSNPQPFDLEHDLPQCRIRGEEAAELLVRIDF